MAKNKHGFLKLAIVGAVVAVLGVGVYHGIKHQDKIKDAWNNLWGIEEQVPEEKPTPDDPTGGEEQPLVNSVTIEVEGQDPTTQSVASGGLMEEPEAPTKEGYIFQGWALKGTTEPIDFSTFIVEGDITLVPLWLEEPVKVTATSATNFTFEGNSIKSYVGEDKEVVLPTSYSLGDVLTAEKSFETFDDLLNQFFENGVDEWEVTDADGQSHVFTDRTIFDAETLAYPVTGNAFTQTYIDGSDIQVTDIRGFGSNIVEKIVIPGEIQVIGSGAFYGCENLKHVEIEEGVKNVGVNAFGDCKNLENVSIPNSATTVGIAFDGCTNLTYNTYDNGKYLGNDTNPYLVLVKATSTDINSCTINSDCKIILNAFYNCENLTSVNLPDGLTVIGDNAFDGCTNLVEIDIPNGVTSIGLNAFTLTALKKVTIPASVTDINYSFRGANSLLDLVVIFESATPAYIHYDSIVADTAIIYVPDDAVESYKTAWSMHAGQIKPVSEYEEA